MLCCLQGLSANQMHPDKWQILSISGKIDNVLCIYEERLLAKRKLANNFNFSNFTMLNYD